MLRHRLACVALLSVAVTLHAQWQLPPGTSSSSSSPSDSAAGAPTASAAAITRAEKLLEAQDWAAAVALLRPVVERDPKNAHAQYDLGFALDAQGDGDGAVRAYEAAASADPQSLPARVSLGLLLARRGDGNSAVKWLRQAVSLPEDAATRDARAQAYRALARLDLATAPDKASEDLIAAVRLNGEHAEDVSLSGEIAEALHDDASAEKAYQRALSLAPGDADATAGYVRALLRQGKQAEAEAALKRGIDAHPASRVLLAAQADLLVQQKRFDEAIPLIERVHAGALDDPATSRLLARAYVAGGQYEKADVLFQDLVKQQPRDGELEADWADSLIRQKRNAEAEQVLQRALALTFPTPAAKANAAAKLAFAAAANHDPAAVIRAVQQRNEILAPDAPTSFLLATAHDTLHHTSQAAGAYRQFLELAGGTYPDETWQAQQRLQVLRRAK